MPVIVAGEAWIRNKGLTLRRQLAGGVLPDPRPAAVCRSGSAPAQLARARRYAYHFFFNRMIPLPFIEPKAGYPIYRLKLERLQQLLPGASPGLDTICDGILSATAVRAARPATPHAGARRAMNRRSRDQ